MTGEYTTSGSKFCDFFKLLAKPYLLSNSNSQQIFGSLKYILYIPMLSAKFSNSQSEKKKTETSFTHLNETRFVFFPFPKNIFLFLQDTVIVISFGKII